MTPWRCSRCLGDQHPCDVTCRPGAPLHGGDCKLAPFEDTRNLSDSSVCRVAASEAPEEKSKQKNSAVIRRRSREISSGKDLGSLFVSSSPLRFSSSPNPGPRFLPRLCAEIAVRYPDTTEVCFLFCSFDVFTGTATRALWALLTHRNRVLAAVVVVILHIFPSFFSIFFTFVSLLLDYFVLMRPSCLVTSAYGNVALSISSQHASLKRNEICSS